MEKTKILGIEYEKYDISLDEIKIDEVANINPMMDDKQFEALKNDIAEKGQLEPGIAYFGRNGKVYLLDGRNRAKALKALHKDTIMLWITHEKLSKVQKMELFKTKEMRRQKSASQIAVTCWLWYIEMKKNGEKLSMQEAAKEFGADHRLVSTVNIIHEKLKRDDIIAILARGGKVNTSMDSKVPYLTDNVRTIRKWLEKQAISLREVIKEPEVNEFHISYEKELLASKRIDMLKKDFSLEELKYFVNRLYTTIKEIENA